LNSLSQRWSFGDSLRRTLLITKKWRTNETAGYDALHCSDQGCTVVLNKVQESIILEINKLLPGDRRDNTDASAKKKCTSGADIREEYLI
jgi:hypothetical protein